MGTIVNKAYVDRSFHAIVVIGLFTIVIFCARGAATYFQAVILSRVGNAIIAENQRKLFDRLMQQNLGFFAERHSSEFLHRLSTGASLRDAGAATADHGGRPRSALADRSRRRDGDPGSGDVAFGCDHRAAGACG